MSELAQRPAALLNRVHAVRAALAEGVGQAPDKVELRVAASVTHLGLVARLIAPSLAVAVMSGQVLDTDLDQVWWQDELGGAFPLSLPQPQPQPQPPGVGEGVSGGLERLVGQVGDRLIDGSVQDLTRAVIAAVSISGRVLWGNVASALNSAASIVGGHQPQLATRAASVATGLFVRMPFTSPDAAVGPGFRRDSCCLIYRVAPTTGGTPLNPASVCADCVLVRG